jgi:hypothetical protein
VPFHVVCMPVEGIQLLIEPAELVEQLLVSGPEFGAYIIWRSWGRGQSANHFYEVEAAVFTGVHGLSDGSWRDGAYAVALADGHGRWGDERAVAAQLAPPQARCREPVTDLCRSLTRCPVARP